MTQILLIVRASATKKFYLVRARSLIRSSRGHKFLAGTRERILVRRRPRESRGSSGPFLLLPFVTVRPSCTACSISLFFSPSLPPVLTDNVVAMVAMGIPSLAFVRRRATACPIFALLRIRPSWPNLLLLLLFFFIFLLCHSFPIPRAFWESRTRRWNVVHSSASPLLVRPQRERYYDFPRASSHSG